MPDCTTSPACPIVSSLSSNLTACVTTTTRSRAQRDNQRSWNIVKKPGDSQSRYLSAYRHASAACALAPDDRNYINTLGVAEYRLGRIEKALQTLERSDGLRDSDKTADRVWDLVFIAMCCSRLGNDERAKRLLMEIRSAVDAGKDADLDAVIGEVEALVESP